MNAMSLFMLSAPFLLLIKGTLILLGTWLSCYLLKRTSAALRHALLTSALCSILLMPLMSISLPSWNVESRHTVAAIAAMPAPEKYPETARYLASVPIAGSTLQLSPPNVGTVISPNARTGGKPKSVRQYSWTKMCVAAGATIWFFGLVLVALQFLVGLRRIERVRRRAIPLAGPALNEANSARKLMRVRAVTFLSAAMGSGIAVPVTWGQLRPTVLLPEQWESWPPACLRAVLLHELAHVQRMDWITQLAGRLACGVYWFHPLVWRAARQAREESERACDDAVLGTGMKAADYAQKLVDVVRSMPHGAITRTVAITMALPSDVEGRIKSMLAPGLDRTPRTPRIVFTVLLTLVLVTAALTTIRLIPSTQAAIANYGLSVARGHRAYLSTITPGPMIVAKGSQAILPNGFKISLVGLTQAKQAGNEWNMFGGLWWAPDGTPIMPENGWQSGHWHWGLPITDGLAPYTFKLSITPPSTAIVHPKHPVSSSYSLYDYTFYDQFDGALSPGIYNGGSVRYSVGANGRIYSAHYTLVDGSSPQYYDGIGGTLPSELYTTGTRTCGLRCGIAQGPWQTISSFPVSSKSFAAQRGTDGTQCKVYFPGSVGKLPNVARRYTAVDDSGQIIPLADYESPASTRVAVVIGKMLSTTFWLQSTDLRKVKAICVQTRPFQTVEFRNVQLQPALRGKTAEDVGAAMEEQDTADQLEQARQLRSHLQPWAQANRTLLNRMANSGGEDLADVVAICHSLKQLHHPLWSDDPRLFAGKDWPILLDEVPNDMTLQHLQRTHDSIETQMRNDFAEHRDFVIAQSFSGGHPNITLWASGRITRTIPGTPANQEELARGYISLMPS